MPGAGVSTSSWVPSMPATASWSANCHAWADPSPKSSTSSMRSPGRRWRLPPQGETRSEDRQDLQTKVMTILFALFAEVERDLISERTREGLARAWASIPG